MNQLNFQTSFVPLPSNQVQNLEQPIPKSTSVIPSNFRPRKSLKIIKPNKKSTEQINVPIQNPDSAQPTTCSRNLISVEENPAALEVLPCVTQNPTKTKPSNSKRKQKEQETEEILQEQNPEIRNFLLKHWSSIRSYTRLGPIQDIFNFYYNRMFRDLTDKVLTKIIQKQKNRFKINYSFGFVLQNIETQSYRYYHSSHNNAQVLDRAVFISNRHDLVHFLNALSEEDFMETLTRPGTKWQIVDITNITFYVTKLQDVTLGAPIDLPDNVKFNSGLVDFSAKDHLCFFRCFAVFKKADTCYCETAAKRLFNDFCLRFQISFQDFKEVNLFDFPELADYFRINFTVYELDGTTAKLVQKSRELYSETMRLNVYENHLSPITDFEKYCHVFHCTKSNVLFNRNGNFYRHMKSCSGKVRETFPGGVYRNPPKLFERLGEIGIRVPPEDKHYPFFACFDFEAFFFKENLPSSGPKLSYEIRYVPMSVAIASCIPGKKDPVYFVSEGDLAKKMLDYLKNLADDAYMILKEKFQYVFDALETSENCRKEKLSKNLMQTFKS